MAHRGRDTASCQFYITHAPQPHLDQDYTVFGEVVENLDAVIEMVPGARMKSVIIDD